MGIQFFRAGSNLYDFPTTYKAVDIIGNLVLTPDPDSTCSETASETC